MWVNLPTLASAPAAADSTSAWKWLWESFAQSVVWNTKFSPSSTWSRRWKRTAWLRHLCGVICEPSTADRGVASWIRSLRATRANRSARPGDDVATAILGTFGRTSTESLARLNPGSCFSKMFPTISVLDSPKSSKIWSDWVTKLRQDCLQRQKLAQARGGNGFSFSRWPTPTAHDYRTPNSAYSQQHRKLGWCKGQQLANYVVHYFRPDPKAPSGLDGSRTTTHLPRLNPRFVCWLMGWPEIAPITSDFSETEWFRFKQRMRSSLFGLLLQTKENHD